MTENNAVKKAVRARMVETGEKYTVARRNVVGGPDRGAPRSAPHTDFRFNPGTFNAVVSGGGMTNLALVMPYLIRMADSGHPVLIAAHEGKLEPWNMASPFDFLTASGRITNAELAACWESEDEKDRTHLMELLDSFPTISFASGPRTASAWVSALATSSSAGRASVLYVPDLQVDRPVADWPAANASSSVSDFDLMPAQLAGLKSVAQEANAIVVGGHCMPSRHEDGWRVVSEIADETIVIVSEPVTGKQAIRGARLDVYSRWDGQSGRPSRTLDARIDTEFSDWRNVIMKSQRDN